MSSILYKAVCARLMQVDFTERINLCCLCLEVVGEERGASVEDEVVLDLHLGRPSNSLKLAKILKLLLGESFDEVMLILKSVCKQCISAAIAGYKFIQRCKDNSEKLTKVLDILGESLDELLPNDEINCESLYVAIQPCNNSKTTVKRYYDIRRQFIPEDTAFLRFSQIVDSQQSPEASQDDIEVIQELATNINEIDQTLQALMCCKTVVDTKELLDNPDKPNTFKCKICKELYAKSTSLRVHFFRVHRRQEFKCVKCKTAKNTQSKIVFQNQQLVIDNRSKTTDLHHSSEKNIQLIKDPLELNNTEELMQNTYKNNDIQYDDQYHGENEEQNQIVPELLLQDGPRQKIKALNENKTETDNYCKKCDRKFSTRARYLTHKKIYKNKRCRRGRHNERGEFMCELCNFIAHYKHSLRRHIEYKHLRLKGHACTYCTRNCYTKGELQIHLRKHTGEKPFECYECGVKFSSKQGLQQHIYIHTGERPYKCEFCDKAFRTNSTRREHIASLHKPPSLKCKICGDMFKLRKNFRQHKVWHEHHDQNEQNSSQNVDRENKSVLEGCHRKVEVQNIVETEFETNNCYCNICGMKFSSRARYLLHKNKYKKNNCHYPSGRGEFKCDLCKYTACYKHILRRHIKYKHLGVKDHVCTYCNRNCCTKGELEVHLRKHTGQKPFQCLECGQKLSSAASLKSHTYTHTGERPFECEFCNKRFRTKTSLNSHIGCLHKPKL